MNLLDEMGNEEGAFESLSFQIWQSIRRIQIIVSHAKVNAQQCQLLCMILNRLKYKKISKSLCEVMELLNLVERSKKLIAECSYLGTAFLDRREEFGYLFDGMNSCLTLMLGEDLVKEIIPPRKDLDAASNEDRERDLSFNTSDPTIKDLKILYEEFLGGGAAYLVYKGEFLQMPVAVKQFCGHNTNNSVKQSHYGAKYREVKSKISHPHILQVFWRGQIQKEGSPICVTELMETNLKTFIANSRGEQNRPFGHLTAIDIMLQIAKAMCYLHDQDIVHGNLALANILMNVNNSLLGNFLVKVAPVEIYNAELGYVAPERFDHTDLTILDKKMDVYAFGIICAEILTGKEFAGQKEKHSFKEFEDRVKEGERPSLPLKCPKALKTLIHRCWNKDPNSRPNFHVICNDLRSNVLYVERSNMEPKKYNGFRNSDCTGLEKLNQDSKRNLENLFQKVQKMVKKKVKVNKNQCRFLSTRCKDLSRCSKETTYQIWEQGNVLLRCMLLIRACRHVETAFLDKTAEFKYIINRINSCCLKRDPDRRAREEQLELEFQRAVDQDLKDLPEALCDNEKLTNVVLTAIAKGGLLEAEVIKRGEMIDKGSYGFIYSGSLFAMEVAIKELNKTAVELEREMLGEVARNNPHLLQMLGYYHKGGKLVLVTEFMKQGNLKDLIKKRLKNQSRSGRPFPLMTAVEIMLQIAEAMSCLHSLGIMHRDLKTANILVNDYADYVVQVADYIVIKVADFGEARSALHETNMTENRGTVSHMAPELIANKAAPYTKKVDVYSFAIMCAEILTGEIPVTLSNCEAAREEKLKGKRPALPPESECPKNLKKLIEDCWNNTPHKRPDFDIICSALKELKEEIADMIDRIDGPRIEEGRASSFLCNVL